MAATPRESFILFSRFLDWGILVFGFNSSLFMPYRAFQGRILEGRVGEEYDVGVMLTYLFLSHLSLIHLSPPLTANDK